MATSRPPDPLADPAEAPLADPSATDRLARAWLRADVCWFLCCSEGTLDRLIAEADFPAGTRLGTTTLRRWRPADIAAWFDAQFAPAATPGAVASATDRTTARPTPHARPSGMGLPQRR